MTEESRRINLLSDTVLYDDAMAFVNEHPELPDMRQLIGLASFSEKWTDLLAYQTPGGPGLGQSDTL